LKLLIDESLSARVAHLLCDAGHEAVHVGDLGLLGAPDDDVMAAARDDEFAVGAIVVLTQDRARIRHLPI
jgi:predicted nuclease of predicted toxin-antitoxin system